MKDKSYLTAITRRTLPTPTRWLMRQGRVLDHPVLPTLDFGCGKCDSVNPTSWDNYDPYFHPDGIKNAPYMIIICNYVLCVKPESERLKILRHIRKLLSTYGVAYITVRNDKPKQGWGKNKRGTYQGRVRKLALPLLYENSQFRIYMLTKKTKLLL